MRPHDQQHLHLQARRRHPAQQPGRRHAGAIKQRFEGAAAVQAVDERHAARVGALVGAQRQVQEHPGRRGDQAHHQRQVHAVPDGQAVFGHVLAQDALRRGRQERADRQGGQHAHQQAHEHQQRAEIGCAHV
ncbi:hypothetical protein G6F22_020776 [Rhizopus arrhizus]|nr:hypothetical protein G6F22_020776 [Rhizopus arrhizus]